MSNATSLSAARLPRVRDTLADQVAELRVVAGVLSLTEQLGLSAVVLELRDAQTCLSRALDGVDEVERATREAAK